MTYLPKRKQPKKANTKRIPTSNQSFYNSTLWRTNRQYYYDQNPLCECCKHFNKIAAGKPVDHIIRHESGGSKLDPENLMTLCDPCHATKSALEKHKDILIDYQGDYGEFLPTNRADIYTALEPYWKIKNKAIQKEGG